KLAHRADLLVSEIFDPDVALAAVKKARPELEPSVLAEVRVHFEREHLTAEQVGELAARAGVGELVLPHNPISPDRTEGLMRPGIVREYQGTIRLARDLDPVGEGCRTYHHMRSGLMAPYDLNAWYCAGWSKDLADKPSGITICGKTLAIYRDPAGS